MLWLWVLWSVSILISHVTGDACKSELSSTIEKTFGIYQKQVLLLHFTAPMDRNNTPSCEMTAKHQHLLCDALTSGKLSNVANVFIICDWYYPLYIAEPPKALTPCNGTNPSSFIVQKCAVSWVDIHKLAQLIDPLYISLVDVSLLKSSSDMLTPTDNMVDLRATVISIRFTDITIGMSTYELLENWNRYEDLERHCLPCRLSYYQEAMQEFPKERFPKLLTVSFTGIHLSDFRCFGEIYYLSVSNGALETIPVWNIPNSRYPLEGDEMWVRRMSAVAESIVRSLRFLPPDSPLGYKDSPVWNIQLGQLKKHYYIIDINLDLNHIQNISYFEGMERLDSISLKQNTFQGGAGLTGLAYATNLLKLDLSDNDLQYLPDNLFDGLKKLELLYLINCNLTSLDSVVKQDLGALKWLDVSFNPLTYVPKELFSLPQLLVLSLQRGRLTTLTLPQNILGQQLVAIMMANNLLQRFPAEMLTKSFPRMGDIVLWGSGMTSEKILPIVQVNKDKIRDGERGVIQLMFNCIEYIALAGQREVETLDRVLDSFIIYLHHNPLHCGCEEMIAWLQSKGVRNTYAIKCTPKTMWLTSTKVKELSLDYPMDRCDVGGPYPYKCSTQLHREKVIKATISAVFGIVMFTSLIVLLRRQSFYFQQWLFIATGLRLCRKKQEHDKLKYDAFVCYCGDDYRYVFQTLLPGLEEACDPPYSLCVHDRDFVVGKDIAENVMNTMEYSRAVILVLSPNSAQSEWCGFEINAAIEERILGQRQLPIIPVILDHVNLGAFTRKQRRVLKKIPSLSSDDANIISKIRFVLGEPLTTEGDNQDPQGDMGNIPDPQGAMGNVPVPQYAMGNIPDREGAMENIPDPQDAVGNVPDHPGAMGNIPDYEGAMGNVPEPQGAIGNVPDYEGAMGNVPDPQGAMGNNIQEISLLVIEP